MKLIQSPFPTEPVENPVKLNEILKNKQTKETIWKPIKT